MARQQGTDRVPLNRARVLRAAVAHADAHGIDGLSMRRLAESLGVVPMALYKHVADKEDLLDGMVDTLVAGMPRVAAERPNRWRTAVQDTVLGARDVVTSHPWGRRAVETRVVRTPVVLGHMEHLTSLFLAGGFTPDLTHHVMHLLGNRIWGFSPELFDESGAPTPTTGTRRRTSGEPDPADYPGILAVAADARARRPGATSCDEDFEFAFALDVLLDAVARLHRAGWQSRPAPAG
ncbi:TetR/AcrR family transcriptional regulator [Intrasporangium flavum]|uniref:TetR/AcrR family transcriptional regulator n=1 Tax=Intrasporangium flavum TaxID=1428657 RepID=UPI00097012F0|nr:TetR/AcrR family transcriptional regulator [Intrasporangium flavum]